jgi:hypothetical protein
LDSGTADHRESKQLERKPSTQHAEARTRAHEDRDQATEQEDARQVEERRSGIVVDGEDAALLIGNVRSLEDT